MDEENQPPYPRKLSDFPLKAELANLILDLEYQKAQLEHLQFYQVSLEDAEIALETTVLDTAGDWGMAIPFETIYESGNLETCLRLILHTSNTGHLSQSDISIAFTWAKEGRVEEALRRVLVVQEEKKLFDALCLILWILADREDVSEEEKKIDCEYVLSVLNEKCPEGVVEWGEDDNLQLFACTSVLRVTEDNYIIRRASDPAKKKTNILFSR
jgi:hypothetical protein